MRRNSHKQSCTWVCRIKKCAGFQRTYVYKFDFIRVDTLSFLRNLAHMTHFDFIKRKSRYER